MYKILGTHGTVSKNIKRFSTGVSRVPEGERKDVEQKHLKKVGNAPKCCERYNLTDSRNSVNSN